MVQASADRKGFFLSCALVPPNQKEDRARRSDFSRRLFLPSCVFLNVNVIMMSITSITVSSLDLIVFIPRACLML